MRAIGIERLHLEQDAGKSLHDQNPIQTYVDLNRSGVALMEIVSKPDLRSAEEAGLFVTAAITGGQGRGLDRPYPPVCGGPVCDTAQLPRKILLFTVPMTAGYGLTGRNPGPAKGQGDASSATSHCLITIVQWNDVQPME